MYLSACLYPSSLQVLAVLLHSVLLLLACSGLFCPKIENITPLVLVHTITNSPGRLLFLMNATSCFVCYIVTFYLFCTNSTLFNNTLSVSVFNKELID